MIAAAIIEASLRVGLAFACAAGVLLLVGLGACAAVNAGRHDAVDGRDAGEWR